MMKSELRPLAGALALVALTCALHAADNAPDAVVLKIYDISALTSSVPDFPGPDLALNTANPGVANAPASAFAPKAAVVPTAASIADMIRTRVRPDTWDQALGTSVEEAAGRLVIMQRPEIHVIIRELLNSFESQAAPQVAIRTLLIPSAAIPDATYFDSDALNKALGGNPQNDAIAAPMLVCHNKQRAHIMSGVETNYVKDVDINGDSYDPVVPTLFSGVVLDVRPIASMDHKAIDLDLRVSLNANVKMNPRFVGAPASTALRAVSPLPQATSSTTTTKKEEGKPAETTASSSQSASQMLNAQYLVGIEMDFPTMSSGAVRTDITVPSGKWVLAGTMANPDEKSPKKTLLLFVTAEVVK
jgi:hypothetical protein